MGLSLSTLDRSRLSIVTCTLQILAVGFSIKEGERVQNGILMSTRTKSSTETIFGLNVTPQVRQAELCVVSLRMLLHSSERVFHKT